MKTLILIIAVIAVITTMWSCGNGGSSTPGKKDSLTHQKNTFGGGSGSEVFIPSDSANKMISSYLNSIDYQNNDTLLKSIIFDADSLRSYLVNVDIKYVKVMFAHTLNHINTEGQGHNVGYKSGALTVLFGGFDASGNYVFWQTNRVPNHGNPCPSSCVTEGNASNDLFP